MTPEQRDAILENIAAGVGLDRALRAACVSRRRWEERVAEHSDLAAMVRDAEARHRASVDAAREAEQAAERSRFAEAMAASAAQEKAEREAREAEEAWDDEPGDGGRWDAVRREAASLGGSTPNMSHLLWVEQRRVAAGLHPLDPQWLWHFEEFYASDKFIDLGRWGVRAAKSDSVCTAILAEVLLMPRRLEPSIVGVCPILSSTTKEAGDRFDTLKANLRAVGFRDITGSRGAEVEPWTFKSSGGGSQALVIQLLDAGDHPCEFRIYAATENVAGCTAIAGFGDELDLWGKQGGANPAEKVVEVFVTRFTTVPQAKLHLMSATYDRASYHAQMIARGDTPRQRVARLGQRGAEKDYADRRKLAASIGSADPLLLALADPTSVNIPCWVSNPIAPIEECYRKMDGDLRRMFAKYGGRPEFAGEGEFDPSAQIIGLADANRHLVADVDAAWRERGATTTHERSRDVGGFGGGGFTGGGGVTL